ncbi:AAA family ATPase [Deinococcus aquaedulcis]|uniref:AAA family ATPase n=1 Tax=Deinococcus aquaedulcis TaxID=2840455 RepID=UPI001C8308A1|nr:AAA family ATPase [Deinococcus aquaedulcis]
MSTVTPEDLNARLITWAQTHPPQVSEEHRLIREDFQQTFPLETLRDLPLEKYVVGRGDSRTFCYALEWGTGMLGSISGGASAKFGVYWSQAKSAYVVNTMFSSPEDARARILDAIVQAAEKLEQGDVAGADIASALMGESRYGLRLKPLTLYFPRKLLPITQPGHLQHFLRLLGQVPSGDQAALNHQLLTFLRAQPAAQAYDNVGLMRFLYDHFPPPPVGEVESSSRAWKVALGERASLLPKALEHSCIFIGSSLPDLSKVAAEDMEAQIAESGGDRGFALSALHFSQRMHEGDIVIANRGTSKVAAVGLLEGPYLEPGAEFNPLTPEVLGPDFPFWAHMRRVRWLVTQDLPLPASATGFARRTITPVAEAGVQAILDAYAQQDPSPEMLACLQELGWKGRPDEQAPRPPLPEDVQYLVDLASHTRNIVLYGPPGTGKTYTAREFAQAWLGERPAVPTPLSGEAAQPRRWWQCIAMALADLGSATVPQLLEHPEVQEFAQGRPDNNSISGTVSEQLATHTHPSDPSSRAAKRYAPYIFSREGQDPNSLRWTLNAEGHRIVAWLQEVRAASGTVSAAPSHLNLHLITFHPAFTYEEFMEGLRPTADGGFEVRDGAFKRVCQAAHANPDQNYVVIIDEINRADTAKTFGELITLIEDDKRAAPGTLGNYSVTLPYSDAPDNLFSVPSNVYVVGTMNTADRSITLMDVALRRRFTFVEVPPKPELLKGTVAGTSLSPERLLRTLNERLTEALDADHRIGHAYLMGETLTVRDVAFRWRHKLIPLLQEYFYAQDAGLRSLLGEPLYLDAVGVKRLSNEALAEALAGFAGSEAMSRSSG